MQDCLFCKMIRGEIQTTKIFEDENIIVIKDINEKPKIHYLMIPKEHYADLTELTDDRAVILGKSLKKLSFVATDILKMDEGFRVVTNKGQFGCQSIKHLHFHLLGGEQLTDDMG